MPQAKPDVSTQWAETGAKTDPGLVKKALGWIAEIPTHQVFNWLLNQLFQFAAHVNDFGIITWDTNSEYSVQSVVRSTVDDDLYISKINTNTGNEPSASPTQWMLLSDYMKTIAGGTNGNVVTIDANGVCVDSGTSLTDILSDLTPQGNWNASTNTPTLPGTAATGDFWIVSVAGSTSLGGITDWGVNDWAVKTATGWAKIDNSEALTSDEVAGIQSAATPVTAANPVVTEADLLGSSSNLLTIIQGSVDDELSTTPGYIDTSDVVEDNVSHNGLLYYSIDGAAGVTSSNWSSVFPITKPANTKRTTIRTKQLQVGGGAGSEEDSAEGFFSIDWVNARINGYMMVEAGSGYANQQCFRFAGSISAGDNDFTGTLQNGSYASAGSSPTFRVNGTSDTITRLPMVGKFRNVSFEITHEK